jgi:hypothetical protein
MPALKKNIPILKKRRLKKDVRLDSLNPSMNPKVRREHLDADYLKKLPPDILKWYAQFIDEYTHASIKKGKRGVVAGHLHSTNVMAKKCGDANNYRNNDLFSVGRANNFVHELDPILDKRDGWYITNHELTEDAIISQLDSDDQYEELTFTEYVKTRPHMIESRRKELDVVFGHIPYAYLFYYIYVNSDLNDYQLDKVINEPALLEKLIKNPKFFKRKKYRTSRR